MKIQKKWILGIPLLLTGFAVQAQVLTKAQQLIRSGEDSLQAGFNSSQTVISGYGSASFQRDNNAKENNVNLDRAVLFVGHQFNRNWSFFSELEVEDAKVAGGELGGEVAMEQAYIRLNLNSRHYFVAGLFIPRIGLLNENHLPINFNGVERPLVEQLIIPATWRELGVAWYGTFGRLQLNAALMNGLDNAGFDKSNGIREGRAEGKMASMNNVGVNASAVYSAGDFRFQVSGYIGGTTALTPQDADSLKLTGGGLGTPVMLGEANFTWCYEAFSAKGLGCIISNPDAGKVNLAYGKDLPTQLLGGYFEAGFDVLYARSQREKRESHLIVFSRLELLDLNAKVPSGVVFDGGLNQRHLFVGLNFKPIPNIALKADLQFLHTGSLYNQNNSLIHIGVGYSF